MGLIGDIYYAFRGDGARLQKDAQIEGAKAGQGLGKSMAAGLKQSWSGKEIGKGLVQGLGLAGGLGAAHLLTMAIGKITDVLGDATAAALEEEVSIQTLDTALRDNIPNWDGNTDAIERVLAARMRLGFSDDEQRASIATLAAATKDQTKALELELGAIDISRARKIDLAKASDAVAKAYAGNTKGLKSMLPGLKLGSTAAETLANAFAMVRGAGEDYAKTNAGKLLVSQVEVGESLEKLGAVTMPLVVEVMTTGAEVATDFADALAGVGESAKGNEDPLQNMANLVHDLFKSPQEDAKTFTGTMFDALNDLQSGLADFAISINDVWTFWDDHSSRADREAAKMADHTLDSLETLRSGASSDLKGVSRAMDGVADTSGDMADDIKDDNKVIVKSWDDLRRDLVSSANDIIDKAYDPIIDLDRLRANTAEMAAQRVIINSKKSKDYEIRDARDKLHELKKNNAEYLLALAEAGQTGDAAYAQGIKELKTAIKNAKGPAKAALQEVLDKIREVERAGKVVPINIKFATVGSALGQALSNLFRAEGGPVQRGVPYVVGERGPEIVVPSVNSRVLTATQSVAAVAGAGQSAGDTIVHLTTQGLPMRAETPAEVVASYRRAARIGAIPPVRRSPGWVSPP